MAFTNFSRILERFVSATEWWTVTNLLYYHNRASCQVDKIFNYYLILLNFQTSFIINIYMRFDKLFSPKSIAIIGVSRNPNKVGYLVLKNLIDQGYKGKIFGVNNKFEGKILGRQIYNSLLKITTIPYSMPKTCHQH